MQIILNILIHIVCISIFWQDFRDRAVSWIFFPILLMLIFGQSLSNHQDVKSLIIKALINLLILIFISSGIVFYFSLKGKKLDQILNKMIGLGDILLLIAITPFFNPFFYCLFIISGSIISLIGNIIFDKLKKEETINIPLAGNLALIFSILLLLISFKILPDINNIYYSLNTL